MAPSRKPNFLIVLIDDLRFDELGICGHPYMKTPNIDRIGHEGAMFTAAFRHRHCRSASPNRASILTGQYASRHGIIDNVARDAHSIACRELSTSSCRSWATRPPMSASGTWAIPACRGRATTAG